MANAFNLRITYIWIVEQLRSFEKFVNSFSVLFLLELRLFYNRNCVPNSSAIVVFQGYVERPPAATFPSPSPLLRRPAAIDIYLYTYLSSFMSLPFGEETGHFLLVTPPPPPAFPLLASLYCRGSHAAAIRSASSAAVPRSQRSRSCGSITAATGCCTAPPASWPSPHVSGHLSLLAPSCVSHPRLCSYFATYTGAGVVVKASESPSRDIFWARYLDAFLTACITT